MPQQQYPHPQVPHPQMFPQSHPQPSQTQPRPHMQQPQPKPHALQPQPARPLAQGVTGHQSYPQPQLQQVPAGGPPHPVMHQGLPPQHSVPGQNQGPPQQPHQMPPPHPQGSVQAMRPPQGPHPNAPHPQQHPSVAHHPVHQPGPQVHHHPGMPPPPQQPFPQPQQQPFPHTQQQPFPQPSQARGPVPQVQQPHGSFPMQHQQHVMHPPQQPLRPQGPYPLQQQLQQPVPAHAQYAQPQNAAGRPMMTMNQAVPQQPLAQPPAQNYMPKSSAHPQMSTVQQQQFQLPRPGSQSQLGASMVAPQTAGFSKQGDSSLENSGKAPGSADGGIGSTDMDGSKMTDMSDSKTVEDEKNVHHGDVDNKPDVNGVVETSKMHGKEPKFGVQEDDLDDVAVEQTVKDEATGKDGNSQSNNEEDREKDSLRDAQEIAKDNSQGAEVGSDSSKTQQDKTESLPTSTQAPLQQLVFPDRETVYPHSGYQDRNLHQLSHQLPGHGPNEHSGMPLADHMQARTHAPAAHVVPLAEQERYPQQPMSYGPPMHQRPPAGPMQFSGLGQERRFQEPSLHQVQPQGQPMRPQVHNFPESLPPHNQMLRQQPPGSLLPEVPAGGYPGPGSIGRGPTHLAPQGQGHALPPHGAPGARPHGQPFGGPLMGGPPPEAINVPASMMGRPPLPIIQMFR
ncbi:hypothetical protein QJS10_CPA03g01797 [Acorus calamus]|uniref:Uncharacterized protein n=1 Tax=Acorus calamus TaxID=4465 RepID=A0AAV9F3Z1_ACOCL|nr:hypothetical protein QJS10_CPA03g01797 [Acorus calamus]